MFRFFLSICVFLLSTVVSVKSYGASVFVVADSLTKKPLASASVFSKSGKCLGMSRVNGKVTCASVADYPLTIRYIGYKERFVADLCQDTVFLEVNVTELPEVVVGPGKKNMLHILAYMREYSTLSSFSDTVTMFREKMVDFMLPASKDSGKYVWSYPRVLNSRSYYKFTNSDGLDSVSDRCNHHFTWSDWVGLPPLSRIPDAVVGKGFATDTVKGNYLPEEIWVRNSDRMDVDVNVLAGSSARKWVPDLSSFFGHNDMSFEQFKLRFNFDNVITDEVGPLDLTGYSYTIESRGRGHGMFKFNRHDEPFYVVTYTEVYIVDKEFITRSDAKRCYDRKLDPAQAAIVVPEHVRGLNQPTLALVERVSNIDADMVRRSLQPDYRLMGREISRNNFSFGQRLWFMLKDFTGVSAIISRRNINREWRDFRKERVESLHERGDDNYSGR